MNRRTQNQNENSFVDFLKDMVSYYDSLNGLGYIPDSSEIKESMDTISKQYGVELYREGTNRSIYQYNGYVYKCCHKIKAVQDNIREFENTEYIKRHQNRELMDHFALSEKFIGGCEYILEQEMITPLHEEVSANRGENEAELSLELLMKYSDSYEQLISLLESNFVIADISPRSIFNYGIKSVEINGGLEPVLAILDYGYFVPKPSGALLECPKCGKELRYQMMDISTQNKDKRSIIELVKAKVGESYRCVDEECLNYQEPIISGRVVSEYEKGIIRTMSSSPNLNRNNGRMRRNDSLDIGNGFNR